MVNQMFFCNGICSNVSLVWHHWCNSGESGASVCEHEKLSFDCEQFLRSNANRVKFMKINLIKPCG